VEVDDAITMRAMRTTVATETQPAVERFDQVHILTCVFLLTIFFNNSIQLSNCDEFDVAMIHDKWKGE
jgi:hypothetical protein